MLRRTSILVGGVSILAMAGILYAQGMMPGGRMGHMMSSHQENCSMLSHGHDSGFFLNREEELNLSEDQVRKLTAIKTSFQKTIIIKEAELKIKELELNELLSQPTAKRSQIEAKAKKAEDLRAELRLARLRARLDARNVLTTEQLKKVQSLQKTHGEMMGSMKGGHRAEQESRSGGHMMMR